MGYIKHHAIVVTSWDSGLLTRAHEKATEFCRVVTPVSAEGVNGQRSFLIAPDGSKEGWADSDFGDVGRDFFVRWAAEQRYDDGSTSLSWVEVVIGTDDQEAFVVRHAWSQTPEPA